MRTVTLSRQELVWQTRRNTWDESDYKKLLEWLEKAAQSTREDHVGYFFYQHKAMYEYLKDKTWDEIVPEIEEPNIQITYKVQYRPDDSYQDVTTTVGDFLRDCIRDDNYSADIYDEEYADDYEEEWYADGEDAKEEQD